MQGNSSIDASAIETGTFTDPRIAGWALAGQEGIA
jgi:hypothetical protein